jgi:hypothetical protein
LALESVAGDLDFVERDGFILISTVEDLDNATEVRVYNCRDLFTLATADVESGFPGMSAPGMPGASPYGGGPAAMPGASMGGAMSPGGMGGGGLGGGTTIPQPPPSRLSSLIQTAVESQSWEAVGGPGSISEFSGLLVIKQSARVHEKIDDVLAMLRKAAAEEANHAQPTTAH